MVRKKKKGEDVVVRESVSSWKWDKWQEEVLEYEGNICIRSGRQVGKSVVVAEKAVRFALAHAGSSTLILAASQRQSGLLFAKVRSSLELRGELKKSPTLTKLLLRNGSVIYSLPAGKTGDFVRGYTLDLLIVDEAAYVLERVWTSILPMVAVSFKSRGLGRVILLSTPQGKRGYFYDCFGDDGFRKWHVSALDCGRLDKGFLERERRRLTASQFAQEWLGEFVDDYQQFFKTELVRRCMTLKSWDGVRRGVYYLGVDVARYGRDETAFVVVESSGFGVDERLRVVLVEVSRCASVVDTVGRCLALDGRFGFRRLFIDDTGVGGGVTDFLQERLGRKVVGLNNASKRVETRDERDEDGFKDKKRGILKEDLYSNVLVLLERGRLELLDDSKLLRSLTSIQYEYGSEKGNSLMIYGSYSHISEALVRACWCVRERGALKNAVLPYLNDLMRKNNIYAHITDLTHGNKKKNDRVIWSLQGRMEHGRITFNEDEDWEEFYDQLIMFPTQGVHDDLVDALSYVDQLAVVNYQQDYEEDEYRTLDIISGY